MTHPGDRGQKRNFTWLWVLVGCLAGCFMLIGLLVLLLGVRMLPDMILIRQGMTELIDTEQCQEPLQAIGWPMRAYSEDWDGRLPPAERWCDALDSGYHEVLYADPGVGRVFACPAAGTPYSYAMSSKLSCARLAEIPHPDKTPLIFETAKTRRNANDPLASRRRPGPHGKWSYVLFADLQCRHVDDDEELSP